MFVHALVATNGGSITRLHLANTYALWSDRALLRKNVPAPLAEAAARAPNGLKPVARGSAFAAGSMSTTRLVEALASLPDKRVVRTRIRT